MVDVNIITNSTSYNVPKKVGRTSDGRIIYETPAPKTVETKTTADEKVVSVVREPKPGEVTRFTIPEGNEDKYEKLVDEFTKKFDRYKINPDKRMAKDFQLAAFGGAIIGGALTAAFIKTKSKTGKFFKTLGGALGGMAFASAALGGVIFYPMIKYLNKLENLGYKDYKEPEVQQLKEEEAKASQAGNESVTTEQK